MRCKYGLFLIFYVFFFFNKCVNLKDINSERNDNCNNRWMLPNMDGGERNEGRPRSSCEVPRVPGIQYEILYFQVFFIIIAVF